MPSTFFRSAVDFDGDGRRDIVDSVPDALASTAKFLQNAGYRRGEPWGFEVRLPAGFDTSDASRKNKRPIDAWRRAGVTLADGSALPDTLPSAGLLVPARSRGGGPAFLVGRNFDTLYSYNASENYALAIAQLSNLVANPGAGVAFVTPWPTDDPGLSRAQNRELQTLLLARGHDIGSADGMIGAKTREAIKAEQQRLGFKPDGRAGQKLLAALR
jgi:peptidoglycan hydrolase-like protein with peptidoglycan-binding domain